MNTIAQAEKAPPVVVNSTAQRNVTSSIVIPAIYDEAAVTPAISAAEKKAMKGEMTLNVVMEPAEHFTAEDDSYLGNILSDHRKGPLEVSVILKDDMKDVCKDLMGHWYNLKD